MRLLIETSDRTLLVKVDELVAVVGAGKQSVVHLLNDSRLESRHSLKQFEEKLCAGQWNGNRLFLRVHKSNIVAVHHSEELKPNRKLLVAQKSFNISKNGESALKNLTSKIAPVSNIKNIA